MLGLIATTLLLAVAPPVVIADGHVDVGPRIVDGRWTLQVRDDTVDPPVWRALPDVVLQATGATRERVPDDRALSFLGRPGAPVWLLPQVQEEGILWPGWNTQAPEIVEAVRRDVTWTLHRVDGPGSFSLFVTDGFGQPQVLFDSGRPFPQRTSIERDTHVHGNWTFSAPGLYRLDIEMSAGEMTDRDTLRVFVGDGDAVAAAAKAPAPAEDGGGSAIPWIAAAVALALVAAAALRWSRTWAAAILRRAS